LPMASEKLSKERVFEISEKYSISLGCSEGIEYSTCAMDTINDNWNVSLDLFADLINNPALNKADAQLAKDRIVASLKNTPSDPGSYVNEIVNRIFYPKNHPYRLNHDESLKELEKLTQPNLKAFHKDALNATAMTITVVSSLKKEQLKRDLEHAFGKIPKETVVNTKVPSPEFNLKNAVAFEHREIPTAYIRAKFPSPSATSPDATATKLMFEILSEELREEIRTKRSLSYSVYAFGIQYSMGIGVVGASTSKPKETLEAIELVVERFKKKTYTAEEIEEYKRIFATSYYLTQETHSSLASAITTSDFYYGNTDRLYEMPLELEKVSAKKINELANKYLRNFRVGIIYDKKHFKESWAEDFVKKFAAK